MHYSIIVMQACEGFSSRTYSLFGLTKTEEDQEFQADKLPLVHLQRTQFSHQVLGVAQEIIEGGPGLRCDHCIVYLQKERQRDLN